MLICARLVLLALFAGSLNAASAMPRDVKNPPIFYTCPKGEQIVALFESKTVSLTLPSGESVMLNSAPAASGARYTASNGMEFWTHQGEATFTRNGNSRVCVEQR